MNTNNNSILVPTLRDLLAAEDGKAVRSFCESKHPVAVAELLPDLSMEEVLLVFRYVGTRLFAEIYSHLDDEIQVKIVRILSYDQIAALLAEMSPDDRADLFKQMPEELQAAVLPAIAHAEREDIRRLSAYAEGTAGAVMTSDYAALSPELTASEALEYLREAAPRKETIYYAYVVEKEHRLLGFVSLKDLIVARRDARVGDIMHRDVIFARVEDDQEEVARKFRKYDLLALPVINGGDALVGIVTVDDVLDIAEEEVTHDFHKMAPVGLMKVNLNDAGLGVLFRARVPWLLVLVFMNIFSGAGIAYFEDTLTAMISLAFFLPLLIDSGGNAGSQSATLMVRALATGDVRMRDWLHLLGKEVAVSLTLGVSMAVAVGLIATLRAPDIVVVVALTMVCTVVFGSLVGMCLPFVLTKLRMDPATASAPLITSLADIGGVLIYFTIATWWLGVAA
jgi:magnesium transporter